MNRPDIEAITERWRQTTEPHRWYKATSLNIFKNHAQTGTMSKQYKAATVLVTPRGMTPELEVLMPVNATRKTRRPSRSCEICGAAFYAAPAVTQSGRGRFCSYKCRGDWDSLPETRMTRFWARVEKSDHGCWVWLGAKSLGYGVVRLAEQKLYAHRVSYEALIAPIPQGLQLDHLCRNRSCVNPDHLEPVSHQENIRRGEAVTANNARKSHCKYGHPFSGNNLVVKVSASGARHRQCVACRKDRSHTGELRLVP